MGFKIKLPKKISLPSLPKLPQITADPSKLISNASGAVTNIQKDVFIKPSVELAKSVAGGVGEVMSQPGAQPLLMGAATAFGGPGAGMLAGQLFSGFGSSSGGSSAGPGVLYQQAPAAAPSMGMDNRTLMIMGGGAAVLILIVALMGKR